MLDIKRKVSWMLSKCSAADYAPCPCSCFKVFPKTEKAEKSILDIRTNSNVWRLWILFILCLYFAEAWEYCRPQGTSSQHKQHTHIWGLNDHPVILKPQMWATAPHKHRFTCQMLPLAVFHNDLGFLRKPGSCHCFMVLSVFSKGLVTWSPGPYPAPLLGCHVSAFLSQCGSHETPLETTTYRKPKVLLFVSFWVCWPLSYTVPSLDLP